MGAFSRMEHKFGHLGIPGLIRILAFFKLITWVLLMVSPGFYQALMMDAAKVLQGEVWRIFSFVVLPGSTSPIFIIFEIMFLFMIGDGLERAWGAFGVTCFFVGSALCGVFASLLVTKAFSFPHPEIMSLPIILSNGTLYSSLIMAAGALYPNLIIQLYLIIPVKLKYIGMLAGGFILYEIFSTTRSSTGFLLFGVPLIACMIPFLLVFLPGFIKGAKHRSEVSTRRNRFDREKRSETEAFHKCDRCGATEVSQPDRDFRINAEGEEICGACRDQA